MKKLKSTILLSKKGCVEFCSIAQFQRYDLGGKHVFGSLKGVTVGEINEFQKLFLELDIGDSVVSQGDMAESVCLTLLMAKLEFFYEKCSC